MANDPSVVRSRQPSANMAQAGGDLAAQVSSKLRIPMAGIRYQPLKKKESEVPTSLYSVFVSLSPPPFLLEFPFRPGLASLEASGNASIVHTYFCSKYSSPLRRTEAGCLLGTQGPQGTRREEMGLRLERTEARNLGETRYEPGLELMGMEQAMERIGSGCSWQRQESLGVERVVASASSNRVSEAVRSD